MSQTITSDQVVAAAKTLGQADFTRAELATELGVERSDMKEAFRAARESGQVEKVGDDSAGTRHFRLSRIDD